MTLVITVAQQKGGSGKTTLAANLASYWAATRRVALLDIDPQHSLARWHRVREDGGSRGERTLPSIGFSDASGWRLGAELEKLGRSADILIVDTPPQIDSDAARAIRAASLVLIPLQPSMPDLWATEGTLELAARERRHVALVLNRTAARSKLRSTVEAEVRGKGVALLESALGNRSAYAQAFAQGMGVTEMLPRSLAATELAALAAEIEDGIGRRLAT